MSRRTGDQLGISGDYQYKAYHEGRLPQRFWHYTKLHEALKSLDVKPGDKIFDAGCGSGVLASMLATLPETDVLAIDASPDAINFARKTFKYCNLEFRVGLIDEIDYPHNYFDKIVCLEVIEHLSLEQTQHVLMDFFTLLRPGGRLVISTPNRKSLWPLIEYFLDTFKLVPQLAGTQHEYLYDPSTLKMVTQTAGFRTVDQRTINTFAPWSALLSWRLAQKIHALEFKLLRQHGSVLLYTFEK